MNNGSNINKKHDALNQPQNNNSLSDGMKKKVAKTALRSIGVPKAITENDELMNKAAQSIGKNNGPLKIPGSLKKNKPEISDKGDSDIEIKMPPFAKKIILPFIVLSLFVLVVIGPIFMTFTLDDEELGDSALSIAGYYDPKCNEITVIFVDSNDGYKQTGTKTYNLKDYIAGVVYREVGSLKNIELYKTFAIAARTYVETSASNCTIEASARKQAFEDISGRIDGVSYMIYEAVEITNGMYVLNKENGGLAYLQYDAFACIDKNEKYYTISQQNQKIPKEWIDSRISYQSHPKWFNCNGRENLQEHHGNGMSQYGAYYLAEEEGYTYDQILNYYYGNAALSRNAYISSIDGLEIKDTTDGTKLNEPLGTYLTSHGSSIEEFDEYIKNSVTSVGAGTREGVVVAAVSLINYLYDNYKLTIPYEYGGKYSKIGVNSKFGSSISEVASNGKTYNYKGIDCSGFVEWAIMNGGFNDPGTGTSNFNKKFSGDSCDVTDPSCIGSVGDLINKPKDSVNNKTGHVVMIVGVDEESEQYMIAEAGSKGVVTRKVGMHSGEYSEGYKVLHMDNYYSNSLNVNNNY